MHGVIIVLSLQSHRDHQPMCSKSIQAQGLCSLLQTIASQMRSVGCTNIITDPEYCYQATTYTLETEKSKIFSLPSSPPPSFFKTLFPPLLFPPGFSSSRTHSSRLHGNRSRHYTPWLHSYRYSRRPPSRNQNHYQGHAARRSCHQPRFRRSLGASPFKFLFFSSQ